MSRIKTAVSSGLIGLLLLFIAPSSYAQINDPCGCNAGLLPTVLKTAKASAERMAFLAQVDEKQYEKIKTDKSFGVEYDFFSVSDDYSKFSEKRRVYLNKNQYTYDASQSESLLLTTTKTDDWLQCKKACIEGNQLGFFCGLLDQSKDIVNIKCKWKPTSIESISVTVMINTHPDPEQSRNIAPHGDRDWQIPRNDQSDLFVTFQTPSYDQSLKIKATPPKDYIQNNIIEPEKGVPQYSTIPVVWGSCMGKGGMARIKFWGPLNMPCNGIVGWGVYQQDPAHQVTPDIAYCETPLDPKPGMAAGDIHLWGPLGETCGGISAWGKYDKGTVNAPVACSCSGHGAVGGHTLWGPKDGLCGGKPAGAWPPYTKDCKESKQVLIGGKK